MPLQGKAQLKNNSVLTLREYLAIARGVLLVAFILSLFVVFSCMWRSRLSSMAGQPQKRGIATVESVNVSGKIPVQTLYLRFKGDLFSVSYSTFHDVAQGKQAAII